MARDCSNAEGAANRQPRPDDQRLFVNRYGQPLGASGVRFNSRNMSVSATKIAPTLASEPRRTPFDIPQPSGSSPPALTLPSFVAGLDTPASIPPPTMPKPTSPQSGLRWSDLRRQQNLLVLQVGAIVKTYWHGLMRCNIGQRDLPGRSLRMTTSSGVHDSPADYAVLLIAGLITS